MDGAHIGEMCLSFPGWGKLFRFPDLDSLEKEADVAQGEESHVLQEQLLFLSALCLAQQLSESMRSIW